MRQSAIVRSEKWLPYLAIVLSVIFCLDLSFTQLGKFSPPDATLIYIRQGVEYSLLNVLYLIWLVRNLASNELENVDLFSYSREQKLSPNCPEFFSILKAAAIFLVLAYLSHPHKITDVYIYLQYGLMVWHGHNPYTTALGDFNSKLIPMLSWLKSVCAYGPISLFSFIIAAAFVPISTELGIYALKFIYLVLHLFNGYLVWQISAPLPYRKVLAIAYLTCPLLLFEQVCNVHVDIFVCTAALLLILSLTNNQFVGGIASIWAGILSRTIPLIWLAPIAIFLVKERRWNSLAKAALLSIGLIVFLSLTIFKSPSTWLSLLNSGTSWQTAGSIHNLFLGLLEAGQKTFPNLVSSRVRNIGFFGFKALLYLAYLGYYIWLLWKCFSRRSYFSSDLVTDLGWASLALLLLAAPWYQPWYASILFPFILFSSSRFFKVTALTFAIAGSCTYYVLTYDPSAELPLRIISVMTVFPTLGLLLFRKRFAWL
jgi:alpha-1,6-mannosyltransferase